MRFRPVDGTADASTVRAGWRQVERLERSSGRLARIRRAVVSRIQYRAARAALPSLRPWPLLPARSLEVYRGFADQIRMWRVCRLLSADDRIVDIGMGHGWLAGVLALAVRPQAYVGIDLTDSKFDSVHEMARVNGLDAEAWFLGVKDLYELTPEWVGAHDPTIVLLLEVLEHLPDPQRALQTIAAALPPRADLLFSVPMLGRVEACWGHVSLFEAARVRRLCDNAGLHVHRVEAVADTWQLVLASTSSELPVRLSPPRWTGRLRAGPDLRRPSPPAPLADPAFRHVPLRPEALAASMWSRHLQVHEITPAATGGVRLLLRAGLSMNAAPAGGFTFPVEGLRVLRLEIAGSAQPPGRVRALLVEGRDDRGGRTATWAFQPSWRRPLPASGTTVVLRPGRGDAGFRPLASGDPAATRTVVVGAQLEPGTEAAIALRRAAYVR
jgi:2-polyprenyl-3-methyl-5-hydroxy-6-metoxy-1,4-benzoquinol methylase